MLYNDFEIYGVINSLVDFEELLLFFKNKYYYNKILVNGDFS